MTGQEAEGLVAFVGMRARQVLGRYLRHDAARNKFGSVRVNTQSSRNVTMCEGDLVHQSSLAAVECVLFRLSPIENGEYNSRRGKSSPFSCCFVKLLEKFG